MAEELLMCRAQVDRTAWFRDKLGIAEVPLERPIVGAEGSSATDPSQGHDMRVVGRAKVGGRHLSLLARHLLRRGEGVRRLAQSPPEVAQQRLELAANDRVTGRPLQRLLVAAPRGYGRLRVRASRLARNSAAGQPDL